MEIVAFILTIGAIGVAVFQSHQANKHAGRTECLLEMILQAMQNNGLAELNRDDDGRITGLNITIHAEPGGINLKGQPATFRIEPANGKN